MKASISKSVVSGTVAAPPSKSYTIRALFAAALADGTSVISNPLMADDTEAAAGVLTQLGAVIQRQPGSWTVRGGSLRPPVEPMDCRQSAATLRFLVPVCAALEGVSRITFAPGLARRPINPVFDMLNQLGIDSKSADGLLVIRGSGGKFNTSELSLPGNISSQFISGLLLAAPLAIEGLTLRLTTPAESKDYLRMTVDCLSHFGVDVGTGANLEMFKVAAQSYRPATCRIEGDWSSASYFLGLGALAGSVSVTGIDESGFQADRFVLHFLRRAGAAVTVQGETVTVSLSPLTGTKTNLSEAIDLLPTAACLAAASKGETVLTGLGRARLKESDRVSAVAENLKRMGVEITEGKDTLSVTGGQPHGAVIDSNNDHRIAMAFAMLASVCGGTVIEGAECVDKTYPGFWDDFKKVGGKVKILE